MPAQKFTRFGLLVLLFGLSLWIMTSSAQAQTPPPNPIETGARLYNENCAVCHGVDGQGRIGATLAKDWPSIRPDLTVRTIIEAGIPGSVMPAWSQERGGPLSATDIDALTQYILSWQTGGPPQITIPPTATLLPPITPIPSVEGDPNRGAALFNENCVVCHGEQAQGRIGATLAKNWPGIRPDLNIRATISNGIPGSQMPAWSAARGGPLSERDIDDLTAFILAMSRTNPVTLISATPALISAPTDSPLSGWAGALLFIVLLVVVIAAALLLQRRKA